MNMIADWITVSVLAVAVVWLGWRMNCIERKISETNRPRTPPAWLEMFEPVKPVAPLRGLCAICKKPVWHRHPWWTRDPTKSYDRPGLPLLAMHDECAGFYNDSGWLEPARKE